MTDIDTLPVWKKIYQVISGFNSNITKDIIEDILKLCKCKLIRGLLEYKPYTKSSYQEWIKNKKSDFNDEEMTKFIHLLSVELDLETDAAWEIICNFFMFEYYGKINELKSIIMFETDSRCLIENIWHFYTSERMFLLKILKLVLEHGTNTGYKFYEQFDKFLKSIDIRELWDNLVKMFNNSIYSIDKEKASKSFNAEKWIHRNDQEQIELLLLLIDTVHYLKVSGNEFSDLLKIFLSHSFARHPLYIESIAVSRPADILKIKYSEIGCLLTVAHQYWKTPDVFKMLTPQLEKDIQMLDMQEENAIVLLLWSVQKASLTGSTESLESCNTILCKLTRRHIFQSLYNVASNEIFKTSKTGNYVIHAVNRLMLEFCKMCADHKYLYEQSGVIPLVSIFMKYKELDARQSFTAIIKVSIEAFPCDFYSLISICKSLLQDDRYYADIILLLSNLPTYLSEYEWSSTRGSECILYEKECLFEGSNSFVVPSGTRVEKFELHGRTLVQYQYPFSFYHLIEQYMNILVSSKVLHKELIKRLLYGYELIIEIIKNYKGDYTYDQKLRSCIQKLDSIPVYFFDGVQRNFELIRMYFSVYFTLVIEGKTSYTDTFNRSIRKTIFNNLNLEQLSVKELFRVKLSSLTALQACLKEEESSCDHSFLLQYIKFVHSMVQKNEDEPMSSGLWYLLNYAFPHYMKWTYRDPAQMSEIAKACISIFVELLQRQYLNLSEIGKKMFECIIYGFMYEEWILKSFLATLMKDKFHLQTMMEQETDWINGQSIPILETLRYQLTFILLLLKQRKLVPIQSNKHIINDYMGILARSVSAYIVNAYCSNLTKLCCKFLEIVARDANYPLLALLGLDYEQVQRLFLDRLRDPLEDEDVKYDIIELINTCIAHQNGMTAAFFNVQCSKKWYALDSNKDKVVEAAGDDTVTDFMIDYLQNIKKTTDYLKNPLQLGILKVMCTLWVQKKQHLISDVVELDQFWWLLADPLWKRFDNSPTVYSCILKIFNIELYKKIILSRRKRNLQDVSDGSGDHVEDKCNFERVVTKFMTKQENLEKWFKYLLGVFKNLSESEDDIDEAIDMIKSWTELLVLIDEKLPTIYNDNSLKLMIIEVSLDGMKLDFSSVKIASSWIDLCLLFLSKWANCLDTHQERVIDKLVYMSKKLKTKYTALPGKSREAYLCTVNSVIVANKEYFESNTDVLLELMESLSGAIEHEYYVLTKDILEKLKQDEFTTHVSIYSWMLVITLANTLFSLKCVQECSTWLHYRDYFNKLTHSIPELLKHKLTLPLAKSSIHSLVLYIESPLGFDKMNYQMLYFYDAIEMPLRSLLLVETNKIHFSRLQEGWFTCTLLVKFASALITKFQFAALPSCFLFLSLNETLIQHIFSLTEATVDLNALDLVTETLIFIEKILVHWNDEWYCKSNDTYNSVMMGVNKIINSCISVILRPKNISFHPLSEPDQSFSPDLVAADLMVIVMNKLIEIIGLAFSCLYKINPCLMDFLKLPTANAMMYTLIINDFSVPNFDSVITYDLSYGRLLCIAHFLCKTLNQIEQKSPKKQSISGDLKQRKTYSRYIGLIEYQNKIDDFENQNRKLSSFLRFGMYEYSGLSDPWISELNVNCVKNTLEMLMIFLCGQVTLAVLTMESNDLSYYQRNLCSELQFFNDYLKRRTAELIKSEVTTPVSDPFSKPEKDLFKRYLTHYWNENKYDKVVDEHFLLVLSSWFSNICQLK